MMPRPHPFVAALALAALSLAVFAVDGLGRPPQEGPAAPAPAPRKGEITILHTNDWHGYALPQEPTKRNQKDKGPKGGVAATAAAFEAVKAEVGAGRVLCLDAGDCLTGFPAAKLGEVVNGVTITGGTFIQAWSGIPYDAWAIGNHDFDAGFQNALGVVKLARAPCLVANLVRAEDGKSPLGVEPYRVFERGGLKVAVIGCTSPDLAKLATAETMKGMRALPMIEAVKPLAERLKKECDLVVALTHAGHEADAELARAVPQLDVIVGGHSHRRITPPLVEGPRKTLIVQAGANGQVYGRLDLSVENGVVVKSRGQLIGPYAAGVTPNAIMAPALAKIEGYNKALDHETVGETTKALSRGSYYMETPVGSFVADAFRHAMDGVDVAFVNSGSVRSGLPSGRISGTTLLKLSPTDNALIAFTVTGAELKDILLTNARAAARESHGILQVSGLRYKWRRIPAKAEGDKDEAEVLEVEVGGKRLDPEKSYRCITSDFIVHEQYAKYFGWKGPKETAPTGITMQGAIRKAFSNGPVEAPDRYRIREDRAGQPARGKKGAEGKPGGEDEEKAGKPENDGQGEKKEPVPAGKGAEKGEGGDDDSAYEGAVSGDPIDGDGACCGDAGRPGAAAGSSPGAAAAPGSALRSKDTRVGGR